MSASTSLLTVGLNHQTAPLDVRGRFAFSAAQLPAALSALRDRLSRLAPEVALLSTCNRTELYLAAPLSSAHAAGTLVEPTTAWLAAHGDVTARELESHLYVKVDQHAARHAFRVASGLDSMVLGETQILGQIKSAVRDATSAGLLGTTLHQLFQRSFAVAKEVRSTTEIGSHSISMAAATVRLAGELFEDLREVDVLFVGAGEMIELVATHFAARQPRSMTLANRTMARGERLASAVGAHVLALSDLPQRLHDFDVVVSCTASTLPIIGLGAVESALKQRRHRPMFMVDLAVPRDIEPEVALLRDVYLYTLDDLMAVVQQGGEKRQAAVAQAEAIIDAGVQSFTHWLDHRASVPLIQAVQQQAESWRAAEVARARKLLARGVGVEAALEALSKGLTQKLLHGAMVELNGADPEQRERSARALSRMYLRHATRDAADETPGSL